MPDETAIDGEIVALDEVGRPSFNSLQNYGSLGAPLHFFIFDVLILKGKDVMANLLTRRARTYRRAYPPEGGGTHSLFPDPRRHARRANPVGEGTGSRRLDREAD